MISMKHITQFSASQKGPVIILPKDKSVSNFATAGSALLAFAEQPGFTNGIVGIQSLSFGMIYCSISPSVLATRIKGPAPP